MKFCTHTIEAPHISTYFLEERMITKTSSPPFVFTFKQLIDACNIVFLIKKKGVLRSFRCDSAVDYISSMYVMELLNQLLLLHVLKLIL